LSDMTGCQRASHLLTNTKLLTGNLKYAHTCLSNFSGETLSIQSGMRNVWPLWQRLQSWKFKSSPKARLPLWHVMQLSERPVEKCWAVRGRLTCLDCEDAAVS
jgi:hypothetical protein